MEIKLLLFIPTLVIFLFLIRIIKNKKYLKYTTDLNQKLDQIEKEANETNDIEKLISLSKNLKICSSVNKSDKKYMIRCSALKIFIQNKIESLKNR